MKLSKYLFLGLVLIASNVSAQDKYNGALQHIFFGRQPSARVEAMGRDFTGVLGEQSSYFYNPAGIASLEGFTVTGSYAEPYYQVTKGSFDFFGATYSIPKYGVIGFSRDNFNVGDQIYYNQFGEPDPSLNRDPYTSIYRLTLAREVIKDLYAGLNFSYLIDDLGPINANDNLTGNTFLVDAGVIKSFNLKTDKRSSHRFSFGTSLFNMTGSSISYADADQKEKLPVSLRLGASYAFGYDGKWISDMFKTLDVTLHADYRRVLNSEYLHGYSFGAELLLIELFAFRAGYYSQDNTRGTFSGNSVDEINEFTYGFGLNVPLRKLTDGVLGVDIKIDVTVLEQPNYTVNLPDWDNFELYTLKINWEF